MISSFSPTEESSRPRIHRIRALLLLTCLVATASSAWAEPQAPEAVGFTSVGSGAPGVQWSTVEWGDYDNDGDLDYVIVGETFNLDPISRIYRNDGGSFTNIGAAIPAGSQSTPKWGDYDSDGDLDLLLIVNPTGPSGMSSKIYRNDAGVFTDSGIALPGMYTGAADWGDYDNDGDLDLLMGGDMNLTISGARVLLYQNNGGVLTEVQRWVHLLRHGSVEWGDYDSDGDLDFVVAGLFFGSVEARTNVVRNDGGGNFVWLALGLPGAYNADWSDYDNDGDLDLLLTGLISGGGPTGSAVYRNDSGSFVNANNLAAAWLGASAWGDFDNNGYQDLIITGLDPPVDVTSVRTNTAGTLSYFGASFPDVSIGDVAWGDYDNDHDLDLLLTGVTTGSATWAQLYRNTSTVANTPPTTPTNLNAIRVGNQVTFSWSASSDAETASAGLSYNLRVGTTPNGVDISPPNSLLVDGHRSIVARGNVGAGTTWTLTIPATQQFFWSVQAVDAAFESSTFGPEESSGPTWSQIGAPLVNLGQSCADWGDYDNDGDLDLLLAGRSGPSTYNSKVYRNDSGVFVDIAAGLTGVSGGTVEWGDYDNDGDLDILLTGIDATTSAVTKIYRNDAGSFVELLTGLLNLERSSASWGDYDNDGDLDILLVGLDMVSVQWVSRIYANDAGQFNQFTALSPGLFDSACEWGDYDNDGDLDVLLAGVDGFTESGLVFRNNAGTFVSASAGLPGAWNGAVDWGDFDNDGDLDILITGSDASGPTSKVFRNDAGSFVDLGAGLPGLTYSSAEWGDYDNDGDLDILIAGVDALSVERTMIFRNHDGSFTETSTPFLGLSSGAVRWSDYDSDGDLDVLITGSASGTFYTLLYRNESVLANTPPTAPTGLASNRTADLVTFSWNVSSDAETPSSGLNYNLRVGTTPGANDVLSPMSASPSGLRRIVRRGAAGQTTTWTISLPTDTYYWSVQAVDNGFMGSPFAVSAPVATGVDDIPAPHYFALGQNAPNPFNPSTSISFELQRTGYCELVIYDVAGHRVRTLLAETTTAGRQSVVWSARDDRGRSVASGAYVYRLRADGQELSRTMVLLK